MLVTRAEAEEVLRRTGLTGPLAEQVRALSFPVERAVILAVLDEHGHSVSTILDRMGSSP